MLEILDAGIASAIYPSALILGMEWARAEDSILVSSIVLFMYPIGSVVTAVIGSYAHNYKWVLSVLSIFGFAMFPCIWTLPESLRWLLVNRKHNEAIEIVEKAAKTNGIDLSPKTYEIIAAKCKLEIADVSNTEETRGSFIDIVTNCPLLIRLMICAFCWASCAFITYGVSIISVSLPGDKYVNFMVVSIGAAPGTIITYFMLKYLARRWSMSVSLFITGASILASKYFSFSETVSLICFFVGKMFIHHAFQSLYLYTNEMWPTVLRHTVMGICSTIARFGSIAAPLTPLLVKYQIIFDRFELKLPFFHSFFENIYFR